MIMKETYLTKEGIEDLKNKLHDLKTVKRRKIAEAIHTAKEQGDLSENAEYVNAKEEQVRTEQEISEIEIIIKNAQVIKETSTDQVDIGNTVTLECDGLEKTYRIVGSNEADPLQGKISNESPFGQALLFKAVGETVSIPTPLGSKNCTIRKIA